MANKMFFGKLGVGKSTVGRIISANDHVEFIDCDKEVWSHYDGDAEQARKSIRDAIESENKAKYQAEMAEFSKHVDWYSLFSKPANYEVSVLGNFYNIGAIPKDIVDRFEVYKIMCYLETRKENLKDRAVDLKWVDKVDAMFEDPQGLNFGVIFNEDVLGERVITPEDEK